MNMPIATSPGRSGFGPQLSLSYDSGSGNGPFGFGWSLSIPAITRKTDKGLPRYLDAEESDVFILSGTEDLVPLLNGDGSRWSEIRTVDGINYVIHRYRPRVEGLFARIERWSSAEGKVHWRSISRDNILTLYGKDDESQIADPANPSHIFSWLICETRDDKGSAILYQYKKEDGAKVDLSQSHQRNRGELDDKKRTANRYLKRIRYCNRLTLLDAGMRPHFLSQDKIDHADWMMEVVFDYGEHNLEMLMPEEEKQPWMHRADAFSSYHSGFEVRTARLCQRVLMFHHMQDSTDDDKGYDGLVRSTDFSYSRVGKLEKTSKPVYTFLRSVTQFGYKLQQGGKYLKRNLPPVEFEYTEPTVQSAIQDIDSASLENLPIGVDGTLYQWTDLHSEGIPGILMEQSGNWFYKRNFSPLHIGQVEFSPLEMVAIKPNLILTSPEVQFIDLAGDGQPDLVVLDGALSGLYEHDQAEGWNPFQPFTSQLNRDMRDPNLKFVDLDGDGHADILISEENTFVWHASLAEAGFGPEQRVAQALEEEKGPCLVFADGTDSIYLADLSGDGLTDLVRIRNGEVCYWPNLGYSHFGAKITMDNSPWFDQPDQFDQKRIRLADIDGTGTTDIIYLHRDGVRLYFNQSGNSWSTATELNIFPQSHELASILPVDLLGNGTACLVWSSPLPGDAGRPMRYVNLMSEGKPHLLIKTINNLGAETTVEYAPSTKFYLQDKQAGKPWITRLPFPVHVVEKVTVTDKWRKATFSTTYSYHHGYFDGNEREFRGFGRVEQIDTESYEDFKANNGESLFVTSEEDHYQPPVKTVTWYHTGAALDQDRILTQFEHEYFPHWFEEMRPDEVNVLADFQENILPEPDLETQDLTLDEWREALRACKGMLLRQEIYELDPKAFEENGRHVAVKLFSTAYHNCHIQRLQAQADNRHAVFLAIESEAITYHYELDLRPDKLKPDPRIAHTLNLKTDELGNVLQSVVVVYPRIGQFEDLSLQSDTLKLIHTVEREMHLAYNEIRFTKDVDGQDAHRLRQPCEVLTYELTGIATEDDDDRITPDPRDNRYFSIDELRRYRLSQMHQNVGEVVEEIPYHIIPSQTKPQKRLVEHVQILYFKDNLQEEYPLGTLGRLGLPYETYKLALTENLLKEVFQDKLTGDVAQKLDDTKISGYRRTEAPIQYWLRSGIAGFAPDADQHFYLPERYKDPFDNETKLEYDLLDLFIKSSTDPLGNTTSVKRFDYRVLAPSEIKDINENLSEICFDALGLPAAMALKGKGNEGDNLNDLRDKDELLNPTEDELKKFFADAPIDEKARSWLVNATARHVYYFGNLDNGDGSIPACACGILAENHVAPQMKRDPKSPIQISFEYSDGLGAVLVKKIQAEPEQAGGPLRWIASGKTILNNKGKPVMQYEPYFSPAGHAFEEPVQIGVTPVMYYDAPGRLFRTDFPDGSYSRVEFSPWHVLSFDQNDTVRDSDWYASKNPLDPDRPLPRDAQGTILAMPEQQTAWHAAQHHNTPSLTILDSLGREVISIVHNRIRDESGKIIDEKYLTFTKLDAEGKPLWIRDARKNLVMQYITPPVANNQPTDPVDDFVPCYDLAGNLLYQHSMDAGDRLVLNDAAGKLMFSWDSRGHTFHTEYDPLHRPTGSFVKGADRTDPGRAIRFEKIIYGDTPDNGLTEAQKNTLNIRGKPYQHYDTAGIVTSGGRNPTTGQDEAFDFKGNLRRSKRQLVSDYKTSPDWSQNPALENEIFTSSTTYDALNRPVTSTTPDGSVYCPGYNAGNLLEKIEVNLRGTVKATPFVRNIDYNAKGQRTRIEYNDKDRPVIATYDYDPATFRLTHLVTMRPLNPETDKRKLQDLSYTYDPVGNIIHIADQAQPRVYFDNDCIDASNQYLYDALYRLTAAQGREHKDGDLPPDWDDSPRMGNPIPYDCSAMQHYVDVYRYDAVGNIMQMEHHLGSQIDRPGNVAWNRRYQYALDSNRLLGTSVPKDPDLPEDVNQPGYSAKYIYDEHGNMIKMPHLEILEWDFKDQLHATQQQHVTSGNSGEKTYYVYDASGRRVRKVTERQNGTRKNERIYLGGFEIYREYNGATGKRELERKTLHIMDDKQRIAIVETRTVGNDPGPEQLIRYQLGNHLGSGAVEVDDTSEVISHEEYYPYGSTSYQAMNKNIKAAAKRYRYTEKERDEESGFYYYGSRYYAPWLGRWMNCDPNGLVDTYNIYESVRGNPLHFVDLSGKISGSPPALGPAPVTPPGTGVPPVANPFGALSTTESINATKDALAARESFEQALRTRLAWQNVIKWGKATLLVSLAVADLIGVAFILKGVDEGRKLDPQGFSVHPEPIPEHLKDYYQLPSVNGESQIEPENSVTPFSEPREAGVAELPSDPGVEPMDAPSANQYTSMELMSPVTLTVEDLEKFNLPLGGSYGELKAMWTAFAKANGLKGYSELGLEIHHIPSNSASEIITEDGPAIVMLKRDHALTHSYKNAENVATERNLDWEDRAYLGTQDIHDLFGNKYDKSLSEMWHYIQTSVKAMQK